MKVLLANPPWIDNEEQYGIRAGSRWPHLRNKQEGLEYYPFPFFMASATSVVREAGHEAHAIDAIAENLSSEEFARRMLDGKYDIICLETSSPSWHVDKETAKAAKATGAVVVLVGQHATALPDEALTEDVDYVINGEYDFTLLEIADRLAEGRDAYDAQGLSYRNDQGEVVKNPARPLIKNVDELPWPARDSLPMEKYIDPFCRHAPNAQMTSSRGCVYTCTFCLEPRVFYSKPNYRMRTAKSVVDEMEYLVREYQVQEIYFDDASFNINQKRVREICELIIERNLKVYWSCMADAKLTRDTLELMQRAGCCALKFGVESAVPEILEAIPKPVDLEDVRRVTAICRELGIETHATYTFGLPGETKETLKTTFDFAFELGTDTAQFSVSIPYPGTKFYNDLEKGGFLITKDWSKYNGTEIVYEYPHLSRGDILEMVKRARKRIVWKTVLNPRRAWTYAMMIKNYKGWGGLAKTSWEKINWLLFAPVTG